MGTGSFLEVKWLGIGVDRPPLSGAEVKERLELYHRVFVACSRMIFTLPLLNITKICALTKFLSIDLKLRLHSKTAHV